VHACTQGCACSWRPALFIFRDHLTETCSGLILIEIDFHLQQIIMTLKKFTGHAENTISEVGVWYCENCTSFHIKAGEILLTFTKNEFAAFSNTIFDCYSEVLTLDDVRGSVDASSGEIIEIGTMALEH